MRTTANGKIQSLQSLRAIAFIGIFLSHAGSPISWPALGVSIFFVLSGFLSFYSHSTDNSEVSIKNNFNFMWVRIKKLYPLHILTMILAILLELITMINSEFTVRTIMGLIGKIFLNVILIQAWVPNSDINTSLNGVAWYLSVTVFLYYMFPYLRKVILNKKNFYLMISCVALIVIEWLICIPVIYLLGSESKVYIWFMYCFPLFRLGDFYVGCCLGKYYLEMPPISSNVGKASLIEMLLIIFMVGVFDFEKNKHTSLILLAFHNWTTVYIPLAAMLVYLFVKKEGIITKCLTNKALIYIGNISAYTFLIHYIFIKYFYAVKSYLDIKLSFLGMCVVIIGEFVLTIFASELYKRYENIVFRRVLRSS